MPRDAARRDQDRIEADVGGGVVGMACEPGAGRGNNTPTLPLAQAFRRVVEPLARLDLDEASTRRRRATMSISPTGLFQRRATMR